jgi:ribonuclease P/MRP protein subunit RPP1
MTLYDLNVPWSSTNSTDLQRAISFLSERKFVTTSLLPQLTYQTVKYSVLALNHSITGAIPSQIINPIPPTLPFKIPSTTTILRRCTLTISDPSLNHRLPALSQAYDILALRPTTEKAFLSACTTLDNHSIISLDLTLRYGFHFRPKQFMTAIRRGIRFEICYAQAVQDGSAEKRRNFISNTLAIVRATKGRGLIVSSEARSAMGVRAPADVGNLLSVWGVEREKANEAMTVAPRSVVVNEGINKRGYRGVIDVVDGGERPPLAGGENREDKKANEKCAANGSGKKEKRKHEGQEDAVGTPPMSKRQAKKMRLAAMNLQKTGSPSPSIQNTPPMSGPVAANDLDQPNTAKAALNG